jgi:hypothetical protein
MSRNRDSRQTRPASVAEVVDLLVGSGALPDLGITESHARVIKARGSIPARRDRAIVAAARRHGLPIDLELLAQLRERHADRGGRQP